jgi:hypothetical protein
MKILISFVMLSLAVAACGSSDVIDSNEQARRSYLALDGSIAKSLTLGFAGFNAATSANIPPESTAGLSAGTITVTGQVDQGSSNNKGMRLHVGMVAYSDGEVEIDTDHNVVVITYDTDPDVTLQPALTLSLKGIPTGTLDGTLTGTYHMTGDIKGDMTLNLTFAGTLADGGTGNVIRAPGTTTISGTATTANNGTFTVDLML